MSNQYDRLRTAEAAWPEVQGRVGVETAAVRNVLTLEPYYREPVPPSAEVAAYAAAQAIPQSAEVADYAMDRAMTYAAPAVAEVAPAPAYDPVDMHAANELARAEEARRAVLAAHAAMQQQGN